MPEKTTIKYETLVNDESQGCTKNERKRLRIHRDMVDWMMKRVIVEWKTVNGIARGNGITSTKLLNINQ